MSFPTRLFTGPLGLALHLCLPGILGLLAGCDLQPRGVTVFKIEGKSEFDKATITFPETAERREPLKLRWADTNTFTTTATFSPGRYLFTARSNDGMHYGREIALQPDVKRYILPAGSAGAVAVTQGPEVKVQVLGAPGSGPQELVVLFIAHDITIRRVRPQEGRISTTAPAPGTFRIEIHALGDPPRSFVRDGLKVSSPVDLGVVTLN